MFVVVSSSGMWLCSISSDKSVVYNNSSLILSLIFTGGPLSRICGSNDASCVRSINEKFTTKLESCNCYPNCDSFDYEMKISKFSVSGQNAAMFTTYDESHFYGYVKRRVFDFEELLAALGGFMGLIGGLSVISVIELFYFMFFRQNKSSEIEDETQRRKGNILKEIVISFGTSSSIHGMNHVSDQNRSPFEK
jgi:Amiloride-sensitive sodium channel